MIRALVFDFDGLILDTETPLFASWQEIYRGAGLDISPDVWASILGTAGDPPAAYEFLETHLGRAIDRSALRERRMTREKELLALEGPLPGVRGILGEARACGLRCGVASSSERAWVEGHLARLGLLTWFDVLRCAEDVASTKPSPELYLDALRHLDVLPTEAIAFEDSEHGVDAAKRAGIFCVAVPNQVTRHANLSRADLVLPSLDARPLALLLRDAEAQAREGDQPVCRRPLAPNGTTPDRMSGEHEGST